MFINIYFYLRSPITAMKTVNQMENPMSKDLDDVRIQRLNYKVFLSKVCPEHSVRNMKRVSSLL